MIQPISINPKQTYFQYAEQKSETSAKQQYSQQPATVPVYGDSPIKTKPAQLSLFQMHDFHGQNIRMEKAFSASRQFDNGTLLKDNKFFDSDIPVDRAKVCSGDMFLGEEEKEIQVVNEFLNLSGVLANAVGNHECDMKIKDFFNLVSNRKYKFLGANMHPDKSSLMNKIISESFVQDINGNKYGFIGLVPPDLALHLKRPEDADEFHISDVEQTVKDLQKEVDKLKQQGINKIILLSHLGYRNDKLMAEKISGIDVILGAHTHNYIDGIKQGENLLTSPSGEPVLITQVGRDGEFIGVPNVKFNEYGQITGVQYNILRTDDFGRSLIARDRFEKIIGKPEVVGSTDNVEAPPKDFYANENPHCDFILDALKSELNTDIAIMNAANIRGLFPKGKVDTRDLALISPFGNKVTVIQVSEAELVDRINGRIETSMHSSTHRPGILQVSGLKYEYSQSKGELTSLSFIDKEGKETPIDIKNPREDKLYTLASDDFCITSKDSGMNLSHRFEKALQKFDVDKDKFIGSYMKKQDKPVNIKSDGRIKVID